MPTLQLQIEGVAPGLLTPFGVSGTEALSTLYAFDVRCTAAHTPLLGPEVLGRPALLTITPDGGVPRLVPGIVGHLDILPPTLRDEVLYAVRILPDLSQLCLSRHNHIFGTQVPVSVADLLRSELGGVARLGAMADEADSRAFRYALHLTSIYPTYSQVVQYEETSFAFLSRLAEHWGLFYFFDVVDGRDQVVFADDNIHAPLLPGGPLRWQPWITGTHESVPDCIFQLQAAWDPAPAQVFLRDYNEHAPHVPLVVSRPVDPASRGNWVEYGSHHRSPAEGAFLARVRAEEMLCRRVRFTGRSTASALAPGRVFTLAGHPYAAWNMRYLVVSVQHSARVPHPSVPSGPDEPGYANSFTAIPLAVPFRPARTTPRPHVHGLLNGRVEGPAAAPAAQPNLDVNGSYRVRLPVDMSDAPAGLASQWVRKAEPYGGPSNGMHFPLPAGTDVVMGCVNGDPDRPVILGAVPSADNPAVVDSGNQRMSRIQTRSGVQITMADVSAPSS